MLHQVHSSKSIILSQLSPKAIIHVFKKTTLNKNIASNIFR